MNTHTAALRNDLNRRSIDKINGLIEKKITTCLRYNVGSSKTCKISNINHPLSQHIKGDDHLTGKTE